MGYIGSQLEDYTCQELLQEIKRQVNAECEYAKSNGNFFSRQRLQQLEKAKTKINELLDIL